MGEMMAEFFTNLFVFIGVYYFVAIMWQTTEILIYGKENENKTDTAIGFLLSAVAMITLSVYRLL